MSTKNLDWVIFNRGGWGDVFIDYAHICQSRDIFNVLFYGYDKYIPKFLMHQDNISEVYHIIPKTPKDYSDGMIRSIQEPEKWSKELKSQCPQIEGELSTVQGRLDKNTRKIGLNYPISKFKVDKPSLLFNPYSIQSLMFSDHCPLLPEIFVWLIDQTKWNIILTGQKTFNHSYLGEQPFPLKITDEDEVDNFQNLVGETESMVDVFHIASQCEGIITTSNCLSLWSIMTNKPALVVMNKHLSNPGDRKAFNFHRNWIEHEPNTLVDYNCTPNEFMETFKKWEKTL